MAAWDWNAIYLTCFGVGLVLSLVALFAGGLHLHAGHLHLGGHGGLKANLKSNGVSPVNGFTLMAFLCWFGGTGYLLHSANIFTGALVLVFSALSGLAGSSLVLWFLAKVLMPREKTLSAEDTEMTGVIGRLSAGIPKHGVGEILYSQNGSRRSAAVRADGGEAIARGEEVVVMRYERGVAYVRRWDEFEGGLMLEKREASEL
jgi:membrane protein implicated in regulation of membrane protease activity